MQAFVLTIVLKFIKKYVFFYSRQLFSSPIPCIISSTFLFQLLFLFTSFSHGTEKIKSMRHEVFRLGTFWAGKTTPVCSNKWTGKMLVSLRVQGMVSLLLPIILIRDRRGRARVYLPFLLSLENKKARKC